MSLKRLHSMNQLFDEPETITFDEPVFDEPEPIFETEPVFDEPTFDQSLSLMSLRLMNQM